MSVVDAGTAHTQALATNPRGSAWVAANAGSGKTYVLSRRVIRLLLAGVDPAKILCLTFTKAAAAEMANRVFGELGRWTTLPDASLAAEIAALEGAAPSPEKVASARRLFARALDTPGGLKIQTIHAFCERLLHQFPFEANVAGHFEVLDERDDQALTVEARRAVLARAADDLNGELGRALQVVLKRVSDRTHEDSIAEFVQRRDQLGAWFVANGGIDGAIEDLRQRLGVGDDETGDNLRARVIAEAPFGDADARRLLGLLQSGSSQDVSASERLHPFVTSSDPELRIEAYLDFFIKGDGEFRKPESLVTKKTRARWTGLEETLVAESARLEALLDRIKVALTFESTVAILTLADAAIDEYDRLKRARGVLDFEDLVVRTVRLLARADASAWVHYKLDRGLDHILVDEAQDTSPRQWQVVRALAEEFFAGEGAGPEIRTLFAVGDEKQSIYSFQGAVPAWFAKTQRELGTTARAGLFVFEDLELHLSFRSAPVILEAVDAVFARPETRAGLTALGGPTAHQAIRRGDPGRVVLWPPEKPPEKPEASDWIEPVDYLGKDSPEVVLARRIAATVRGWLDSGETLDATGKDGKPRPIRPGGILILVRYRGALADAIIRELKTQGVPIAGADRLTLTEHIAVMDLIALGRVVLLPEDDLSLAALLKSPLVGLNEDALYDLAIGRKGSLWESLSAKSSGNAEYRRVWELIDGWRREADWRDPHTFYARILGPGGGRKAFLRRLGPEAEDVLDEFLAEALAFERTNVPSLEGFLAWLVDGEAEIKRDTDVARDEVRVMTVHGAKGLEADVVFLVDNGTAPHVAMHDSKLLSLADEHDPDNPGPFVWMRSIKQMPAAIKLAVQAKRTRAEEEYRRLLYVGMTRARDRLFVVGIDKGNIREENDRRWHKLVRDALSDELTEVQSVDGTPASEWRAQARAAGVGAPAAETTADQPALPAWVTAPAPAPTASLRRITPSRLTEDDAADVFRPPRSQFAARSETEATEARERGRLVHRLLQSLPDIEPAHRVEASTRFLDAFADGLPAEDRARLLAEALAVMDAPGFAAAFVPGSRSEVEIAGRIATPTGEATIAGRVDRLAVTDRQVLIVDYKTNRPVPAEVPPAYVAQLAGYRALLRQIYPGKNVAAAVLWTAVPALVPIPDDMLNRAELAFLAG